MKTKAVKTLTVTGLIVASLALDAPDTQSDRRGPWERLWHS
jgi:hypothetical protein